MTVEVTLSPYFISVIIISGAHLIIIIIGHQKIMLMGVKTALFNTQYTQTPQKN